jgi:hypothetical protein
MPRDPVSLVSHGIASAHVPFSRAGLSLVSRSRFLYRLIMTLLVSASKSLKVPVASIAHRLGVRRTWNMTERRLLPREERLVEHVMMFTYPMNSCQPSSIRRSRMSGGENPDPGVGREKDDDALLPRIEKRNTYALPTGIPLPSSKRLWQKEIPAATANTWSFPSDQKGHLNHHVPHVLHPIAVTRLRRAPSRAPLYR